MSTANRNNQIMMIHKHIIHGTAC